MDKRRKLSYGFLTRYIKEDANKYGKDQIGQTWTMGYNFKLDYLLEYSKKFPYVVFVVSTKCSEHTRLTRNYGTNIGFMYLPHNEESILKGKTLIAAFSYKGGKMVVDEDFEYSEDLFTINHGEKVVLQKRGDTNGK